MKRFILPLGLLFSVMVWAACQNKESSQPAPPASKEKSANAISEMAALMKKIDRQTERLKLEIQEDRPKIEVADFSGIRTATTTKENIHSPGFSAYAESYLAKQSELAASPVAKRKFVFNEMIDLCMSCHYSYCPGPTSRIKRYYLPTNEVPAEK